MSSCGAKHKATDLTIQHNIKCTDIFVPEAVLPYIKDCVANHQHLQEAFQFSFAPQLKNSYIEGIFILLLFLNFS